jgi:hypothetical protein
VKDSQKLLLIVGIPRSGTKLLRNILINHGGIYLTHELLFLPTLLANWDRYGAVSEFANFRKMYKDVMGTYYFTFKQKRGDVTIGAREWYDRCTRFDPLDIFSELIRYETGAPDDQNLWLGDKSPNYTTHLPAIRRGIPDVRIIHIVRDARDVALSAKKVWKKNIYRSTQRWSDGMRKLQEDLGDFQADHFREVRYEDLLEHPEDTVRCLLDFLGLEYRPDILTLRKSAENLGDTRNRTKIMGDNVYKYKTRLNESQVRRLESVSRDMLERYGYEVGFSGPIRRLPAWLMAWYMFCDVFNRVAFDIKLRRSPVFAMKSLISRYRTRI